MHFTIYRRWAGGCGSDGLTLGEKSESYWDSDSDWGQAHMYLMSFWLYDRLCDMITTFSGQECLG